jgi:hypothetical protein
VLENSTAGVPLATGIAESPDVCTSHAASPQREGIMQKLINVSLNLKRYVIRLVVGKRN